MRGFLARTGISLGALIVSRGLGPYPNTQVSDSPLPFKGEGSIEVLVRIQNPNFPPVCPPEPVVAKRVEAAKIARGSEVKAGGAAGKQVSSSTSGVGREASKPQKK